ncbi:MAG TPA: XkdF-like putative serine protease domain-containing protein [Ignavibacteriaceae bacterium]|nr:XkdF-like putative serine protease domain-containing protein [Ignavibacteriaceae bacterium]
MEAKRILKKVEVNFISLVKKGANNKTVIYKNNPAEENYNKNFSVKKVDDEKNIIYGIVYSPDEVDLQGDTASAEVINEMAYQFMKSSRTRNIDHQHNENPVDAYIAESWLIKKGDPVFPNEKEGSWAVAIKIDDKDLWQLVKSGEISGLSIGGFADIEEAPKKSFVQKISGWVNNKNINKEENKKSEHFNLIEEHIKEQEAAMEKINALNMTIIKRLEVLENHSCGSKQILKDNISTNSIWL